MHWVRLPPGGQISWYKRLCRLGSGGVQAAAGKQG